MSVFAKGVAHCRARDFDVPPDNGARAHFLRFTRKSKVKHIEPNDAATLPQMMEHSVGVSSTASRPVGMGTHNPWVLRGAGPHRSLCSTEQDDRTETS